VAVNVSGRRAKRIAAATATAAVGLVLAAPAAGAAGPDAITNGDFQQPGTNGATPTGWTPTSFGVETAPFNASIATYDSTGRFKPPTGVPGGDQAGSFASEAFYQAGSATGIEGYGGVQALAAPVQSTSRPQLSWSTVEAFSPSTSVASWAGSLAEVDLSSGGQDYQLRYLDPFTPQSGSYAGDPRASNTATTKYVVLAPLAFKQWRTETAHDLSTDVLAQLGLATFTVTAVRYGDLELATSASSPYPNMTSYWKNLSLQASAAVATPALPESALALGLPVAGLTAMAIAVTWLRRRSATS